MAEVRLFCLCMFANVALAQNKVDLYFVSGHPFRNIETQFPSTILKLENDSLKTICIISNKNVMLSNIKVNHELRLLSAITDEYRTVENKKILHFVHLDRPDTVFNVEVFLPANKNCSKSSLIQSKKGVFECFTCYDKDSKSIPISERTTSVYGYDVNTLERKELSPDDLKFSVAGGSSGGAIEGDDYFLLYTSSSNGKLRIPVTADTALRPLYPISLPESLQLKQKKRTAVLSNNNDFFAMMVSHSETDPENPGYSEIVVYDKGSGSFFKQRIKGNDLEFRSFGKWIAGDVIDMNSKIIYNDKGQVTDEIKFKRISPGKNQRRKNGTSTGTPFDLRTDFLNRYYPGILYLLDTKTKNYIEWSTGQGDSEILLAEGNKVYYRINDEILKAEIIDGKKLGKAQRLLKNDLVPDIHWAFISKEQ